MEFLIYGVVFGPLLLLFVSRFLQGKGLRIFVEISAVIFFISAVILFVYPLHSVNIHLPSIIWKAVTLIAVFLLILYAVRDKLYSVAVLILVQAIALVILEITVSPREADPFLWFSRDGRLFLLAGAFIMAALIPLGLRSVNQYDEQSQHRRDRIRQCVNGLFFLMVSYSGLIASNSLTALFLFWQAGFLANRFFHKTFQLHQSDKVPHYPLIQQGVLVLWMVVIYMAVYTTGSPDIFGLNTGLGSLDGFIAVIIFITVSVMACFVPEKQNLINTFSGPGPVAGLNAMILSLLAPIMIFIKFRPLFMGVHPEMLSLFVILASFAAASYAYYAVFMRSSSHVLVCVTLFAAGLGISNLFLEKETLFFIQGYILVASITLSFLWACITVLNLRGATGKEQAKALPGERSAIKFLMILTLFMFIFAPFNLARQRVLYVSMMSRHPIALFFTVIGLVLTAAVLFRWLPTLLVSPKRLRAEHKSVPLPFKILLSIMFFFVIALNTIPGILDGYIQAQPVPANSLIATDIIVYRTGLEQMTTGFEPVTAIICLGTSLLVLPAAFILVRRKRGAEEVPTGKAARIYPPYSPVSWIPGGVNAGSWIRAGWVTGSILLVGVALSCLL